MTVQIETVGGRVVATTPYNPDYVARAKELGGRWDAARRAWSYDAAIVDEVRGLCRDIYGEDGETETEAVTVRVTLDGTEAHRQTTLVIGGRSVARIYGRDSGPARVAEGVSVVSGRLRSGGSMRHPQIRWDEGTVIEVRNVPATIAERIETECDYAASVEIVRPDADRDALREEGRRLRARLREIEAALGEVIL